MVHLKTGTERVSEDKGVNGVMMIIINISHVRHLTGEVL